MPLSIAQLIRAYASNRSKIQSFFGFLDVGSEHTPQAMVILAKYLTK
jgi:hypothetical protein